MTKEKILQAAKELFEEKGFDLTTIREIALKADVNIALINYHFGSKELLFATLINEMANANYLRLTDINKSNADPFEKLQNAIDLLLEKVFDNKKYYQMLQRELSTTQRPEINGQIAANLKRSRSELQQLIEDGQKKKVFRQDIDIELTLGTLFGLLHQVTNSGAKFSLKGSDVKIKSRIRQHLFDMFGCFLKK